MSVGAQLRQARQDRSLTIGDVSLQTKIQPWVLEALEADQLHNTTMSPIYARGFLSTYARFLRLDPAALLSQMTLRKDPILEPPEPAAAPTPAPAAKPAPVAEPPATAVIAEEPAPTLPSWSLPTWQLPEWHLPQWDIPWDRVERLRVPALVLAAVAALVLVKPQRWLPTLPRIETPHQQASVSVVQELPPPAKPPVEELKPVPVQALELAITVRRATWVQVRADGRLLTQQRLRRGAQESWHARKRLEIVIAKPEQVDLNLNGGSISPLAMAHGGRLLITPQGVEALPERP